MKGSQRMRKRILVLLLLGSTVMANGDTAIQLRWDNLTQRGGPDRTNEVRSVALHRNRVVTGAFLGHAEDSNVDVVIQGFNARTGRLVWSDEFPALVLNVLVEAGGDVAVAVGRTGVFSGNVLIRAYDLATGVLRWSASRPVLNLQKILIRHGKLVIVGNDLVPIGPDNVFKGVVDVLDAGTGLPLWNVSIAIVSDTTFMDVDDAGQNIVVVGSNRNTGPAPLQDLNLRSYRLSDGLLRWQRAEPLIFGGHVQVANGVAYVVARPLEPENGFVAAYQVADGQPLWKTPAAIQPSTTLAVTTGAVITNILGELRAYHRLSGNLLWSNTNDESIARLIALGDDVVTVGTKAVDPPGLESQLVIRILDAAGQVVAEDLREIGPGNAYLDAALLNDRLAAVGRIGGIAGGALVRVYDIETQRATRWQDSSP
jgi:outer membrane protein assembly factor BamB